MSEEREGKREERRERREEGKAKQIVDSSLLSLPFSPFSHLCKMSDSTTTLDDLKRLIDDFVDRRDWHQFHAPKNLAMSMAIESAELMEHFQWISAEQSRQIGDDPRRLETVADELSDVLCYALAMANELQLDVSTAIRRKMAKNEQKYPAEEYRGRFGPEDKR